MKLDSSDVKKGYSSVKIKIYSCDISKNNPLRIYQLLKIPSNVNDIRFSFWTKNEKLTSGLFRIAILDSMEHFLDIKEIPFSQSPEWSMITDHIENKYGQMMYIEFEIGENSTVWLDHLEIKLNGRDFYDFTKAQTDSKISDVLDIIDPEHMKWVYNDLSPLMKDMDGKKIIGIGETSHGNHEMADFRNMLIKELILKKECKLVILEAPELFAEHLNKYVQGYVPENELFRPEDLAIAQYSNLSQELLELLQWIRKFNCNSKNKVVISGMDVSNKWQQILAQSLKPIKNNQIRKYLNNSNSDSLLNYLSKYSMELVTNIGVKKFDSILYNAIKFNQFTTVYSSFFNDRARDSIMALNVIELMNKYISENEKVVVCGHLAHLNKQKIDNSICKSVGNYLLNKFDENYFVIGLLADEGDYQAYQIDPNHLNIHPLATPIYESLEYYASKLSSKPFYLNIQNEPFFDNRIISYRSVGGIPWEHQFFPGNVTKRFDAIVFLPNVTPLRLLPIFEAVGK